METIINTLKTQIEMTKFEFTTLKTRVDYLISPAFIENGHTEEERDKSLCDVENRVYEAKRQLRHFREALYHILWATGKGCEDPFHPEQCC